MSRFFRATRPFLRSIGKISTPFCVTLGAASTVPTQDIAPEYARDVFDKFKNRYHTGNNSVVHEDVKSSSSISIPQIDENEQQEIEQEVLQQTIQPKQTEENIEKPTISSRYLSRFIDHTVLKPMSDEAAIRKMVCIYNYMCYFVNY